jgi:hypothetical protein
VPKFCLIAIVTETQVGKEHTGLYGCETCSLILRKEHKLIFDNWVMGIFGLKKDKIIGSLRNSNNEALHNFNLC